MEEQTDLVMTYRRNANPQTSEPANQDAGAYEVWAKRGMVRFVRSYAPDGGYAYRIIEQVGENPIADQDPTRLSTIAEELQAAAESGHSGAEPAKAFIEPEQVSYPLAYETDRAAVRQPERARHRHQPEVVRSSGGNRASTERSMSCSRGHRWS